ARHAPVPLLRAHVGEHDELDASRLHGALFQRAHDLVVAAGHGELQFSRHIFPRMSSQSRQRAKRISSRRMIALSTIAMAASVPTRPRSLVGSKFCVNSVVK